MNPHLVVGFLLLVDVVDYCGLVFLHADVDYAVAVVDKDVVVVVVLNAAAAVDKDVVVYNVDVVDYDAVLDDYEVGFVVVVVVVVVDAIGAAS